MADNGSLDPKKYIAWNMICNLTISNQDKLHLKLLSAKYWAFYSGLNMLIILSYKVKPQFRALRRQASTKIRKEAFLQPPTLSHWDWVTHICVGDLTIIGSDNGLSPDWRRAITWTNVGILLIVPLGINLSEILI